MDDQLKAAHQGCQQGRTKRTKCDGKQNCQRCRRQGNKCVYEERRKESKDVLHRSRSRRQESDAIIEAQSSADHAKAAVKSLLRREPIADIAPGLSTDASGKRPANDAQDLRLNKAKGGSFTVFSKKDTKPGDGSEPSSKRDVDPETRKHDSASPNTPTMRQNASDNTSCNMMGGRSGQMDPDNISLQIAQSAWGLFGLTAHELRRLINTFFDCQPAAFFTIDKGLFMHDFLDGGHEYCSPSLLRAVICLACRMVDGYDAPYSFFVNLGYRLFDEARELAGVQNEPIHSLADGQALGLLSIHQIGSGNRDEAQERAEESVRRLSAACDQESLKRPDNSPPSQEKGKALLGAITLARVIRLTPHCLADSPSSHLGFDAPVLMSTRSPLPKPDSHLERLLFTSHTFETALTEDENITVLFARLSSCVYCFLWQRQPADSEELPSALRNMYETCLSWYNSIPAISQRDTLNKSVKYLTHLFYHFCLLTLFRPFRHVEVTDSNISPGDICLKAALAILDLSKSYSDTVSQRTLPCFIPLFVYGAGLASVHVEDNNGQTQSMTTSTSPSGSLPIPTSSEGNSPKLNVTPITPLDPRTSARNYPVALEAIAYLDTLGDVFPAARGAKEQLQLVHDQLGDPA